MDKIVDWLCGIEEKLEDIYRQSARIFSEDPEFSRFLEELSEQEREHSRILREAFSGCDVLKENKLSAVIDEKTRKVIIDGLNEVMAKVSSVDISREAMSKIIADIEFHEWNGIFLFAMKILKGNRVEYGRALLAIEKHLNGIETYFEAFPQGRSLMEKVRTLSSLGRFKVLVVEDDPALAELIKNVLIRDAVVIVAHNGREGLEQIRIGAFDAIITDVDMPVMNGIEMFQAAVRIDPRIKERFIFLTASRNSDWRGFFAEHDLPVLYKPSPLNQILQAVLKISTRGT